MKTKWIAVLMGMVLCTCCLTACGEEASSQKDSTVQTYVDRVQIDRANSMANTVATAAKAGLNDMMMEEMPVNLLGGDIVISGASLQTAKMPLNTLNKQDMIAVLTYKIAYYLNADVQADVCKNLAVHIQDGDCTGVGIELSSDAGAAYGSYPNVMTADDVESISSVQNALTFALK